MVSTKHILSSRLAALGLLLACAALPGAARAQDAYGQMQYGQQPGYPAPGMPQGQQDPSQIDPPSRVARVSVLQGNVSLQPAGVEDFSAASMNYPLTTGDRLYTDNGAVAELEAGQLAVRLGGATDLSVTQMTDQLAQFGLGQGSVHLRSFDYDPNSTLELDTPNVAVTVLGAGDIRVDVMPDGNSTVVTLIAGQARMDGQGFQQMLRPGESLQLSGAEPVYAQDVRRPRADALDRFSSERDNMYQSSIAAQGDYVSPDTIGAADLGAYGDWAPDSDYGPVWYPRAVAVDWQPYTFGHWAYIAPWGWTWVENEPWGFAPFHYGRWARIGPRWGWIPGPRVVRPVYSPALVVFVGGGAGVTAWFPLGPREPYQPWYRSSALYVDRVNVSNIYNRNPVEVRNIYNQRVTNVYVNTRVENRVYANRSLATVAVRQDAFAAGRPVHDAVMRVPPGQLAQAPILQHPMATPTRAIMAPAPARAMPARIDRPAVESRGPGGQYSGGGRPGNAGQPGTGVVPAVRPGSFGNQPVPPQGGNANGRFGQSERVPNQGVPYQPQPRAAQPQGQPNTVPATVNGAPQQTVRDPHPVRQNFNPPLQPTQQPAQPQPNIPQPGLQHGEPVRQPFQPQQPVAQPAPQRNEPVRQFQPQQPVNQRAPQRNEPVRPQFQPQQPVNQAVPQRNEPVRQFQPQQPVNQPVPQRNEPVRQFQPQQPVNQPAPQRSEPVRQQVQPQQPMQQPRVQPPAPRPSPPPVNNSRPAPAPQNEHKDEKK